MNSSEDQTIFFSRPERLARILTVDDTAANLWTPEEMQAMWRHQYSAPIDVDLDSVVSVQATQLRKCPSIAEFRSKTFAEVLTHVSPPIELLKLIKEFAKQTLQNAEERQLKSIASALYYASYAAGLMRHRQQIGSMSFDELRPGFDWMLDQPWMDPQTRKLVSEAREFISPQTRA
jgi:hypothetical protein